MKKNEQIKDFSKMSKEDLNEAMMEKRESLRVLRFDLASGKIKDISPIRETKKSVARMKTFINKN